MRFDSDDALEREVSILVAQLIDAAKEADLEINKDRTYHCDEFMPMVIGAMSYYVSALAGATGRDHHTVEFMISKMRDDIEHFGMTAMTSKLKTGLLNDSQP